jgi:hydrogenase expression/formation protein HypC
MCLAIPMQIVSMDGPRARCSAKGVCRDVSLTLLGDAPVAVGDHVLVHVGYAIQSITAADAALRWALFDELTTELDLADA